MNLNTFTLYPLSTLSASNTLHLLSHLKKNRVSLCISMFAIYVCIWRISFSTSFFIRFLYCFLLVSLFCSFLLSFTHTHNVTLSSLNFCNLKWKVVCCQDVFTKLLVMLSQLFIFKSLRVFLPHNNENNINIHTYSSTFSQNQR